MVRTTGSHCATMAPWQSDATDGRDRDKSGTLGYPRRLGGAAQRASTIIIATQRVTREPRAARASSAAARASVSASTCIFMGHSNERNSYTENQTCKVQFNTGPCRVVQIQRSSSEGHGFDTGRERFRTVPVPVVLYRREIQ